MLIINLIRKSLQLEISFFMDKNGGIDVSKQAFSQARRKLKPLVFKLLNKEFLSEFYTDNEIKTFQGFRVLAIDGTTIQLPSSKELINHYGTCRNQSEKKFPISRSSTLFDVLNNTTIHASIAPYSTSEKTLAIEHVENIIETNATFNKKRIKDLILFDRGYPSMQMILLLNKKKIDFLMRCSSNFIKDINDAVKNGKIDQIVEIKLSSLRAEIKKKLNQNMANFDDKKKIKVRVLLFKLKSGEQEILLTSLLEKKDFPPIKLFDLYAKRWDIEENYKFYKSIAELKNFSGKSKLTIEQDFFATVFTCNVATILMQEAQNEINETLSKKGLKYEYKVNKNIGLGLLKDELIEALISNQDLDEFCLKIKIRMQKNLVPVRPNRSFPRKKSFRRNYPSSRRSCL